MSNQGGSANGRRVGGNGHVAPLRITGGQLLGPNGFAPGELTTSGHHIESITMASDGMTGPTPLGATLIDATDLMVCPGFIDLQINGGFGYDLGTSPLSVWPLANKLPSYGVTSFLPTIVSSVEAVRSAGVRAVSRRPNDHRGAEPLGLHFEGPMLNPDHRGIHSERQLVQPSTDVIASWHRDNGVAMATVAPDLPAAAEVIRALRARGIVVAGGHTGATASQTDQAVKAGMTVVTHLFNAMSPMHHRDPGIVGYTLASSSLTATIIADGKHLDPLTVALAWRAKGPDHLVVVSDAVAALGMPPGTFDLGPLQVTSDGTTVYGKDGQLAGSALALDSAIRNLITFAGCNLAQAVRTVTANPARLLGRADIGVLRPGARADLVILDRSARVVATICGGQVSHIADGVLSRLPPPR
jgi:N-acetylglucosamine-6-phosphate deacetylase